MKHQQIFKAIAVLFFACFLASCIAPPTASEIASAYYGRDMTSAECQAIAERQAKQVLIDPDSARFRHRPCRKGNSYGFHFARSKETQFGWLQVSEVNSKNSFGGYVGFRPYMFLIRNGQVIERCSDGPNLTGCTSF